MELSGAVIVKVPPALSANAVASLCAQLHSAFADPMSHVVVMLGDEQTFCRGLDLGQQSNPEDLKPALETFAACLELIRSARKPVLAVIRGTAAAGGVGLAAACDWIIATHDATFTLTELLFGLVPAIILPCLAERLAPQKLRWLGLSAHTLSADAALQLGLVDVVCGSESLPDLLRRSIRRLQRTQPDAVAKWKEMTAHSSFSSMEERIQVTLDRLRDPQVRAGFEDFNETGRLPSRQSHP